MNIRTSVTALGVVVAIGSPLAVLADGFWESTNDGPGSRIVHPQSGSGHMNAMPGGTMHGDSAPPAIGDASADGQYACLGEEGGWQLHPMQYRFEGHRMVHLDDPVGHMHRLADHTPLTAQQRLALERSAGR